MYAVVAQVPKSGQRAIGSSRALFSLTVMIGFGIVAVTSIGCVAAPPQSGPVLIEDLVATRKFTLVGEAALDLSKRNLEFCKSVFAAIAERKLPPFVEPVVTTDDPDDPALESLNQCRTKPELDSNDPEISPLYSARFLGDQDFRLYRIDGIPGASGHTIEVGYAESSAENFASNLMGGYFGLDTQNCQIRSRFGVQQHKRVAKGDIPDGVTVASGMVILDGRLVYLDATAVERFEGDPMAEYNIDIGYFDPKSWKFKSACFYSTFTLNQASEGR